MTENIRNIKIDEILPELQWLREQNEQLKSDNKILGNELTYFKERCVDLEDEVNDLTSELKHYKGRNLSMIQRCRELSSANMRMESEIADMKFTRKYLTSEEAGRQFARELLSTEAHIEAELAAERMENETVSAMGSFLGDD